MKKFFTVFFVTLGVLFLALVLVLAYLFVFDPLQLKPLFMGNAGSDSITTSATSAATPTVPEETSSSDSRLSPAQAAALESVGIAPAAVPTFTEVQLQCFVTILGQARVDEIKAGATPSATEFFKAKSCI